MIVSISRIRNSSMDVRSDVPQGSMLGPLLFFLFIHHLPTYIVSKCTFFADDLKIYSKIRHSNIVDMSSDLSSCQKKVRSLPSKDKTYVLSLEDICLIICLI